MHLIQKNLDEFSPKLLDSYFLRLAQASDSLDIRATTDIITDSGKLIFTQGERLSQAQAIAHFQQKSQQEISELFSSEKTISFEQLREDFELCLEQDEFLCSLNHHIDLKELLQPHFSVFSAHFASSNNKDLDIISERPQTAIVESSKFKTDLSLRISVLKLTCPEIYTRTLLVTWLCLLVAKEMRLSKDDVQCLLISSLCHDLGMMHVSSEVLSRKDELSPDDWFEVRKHIAAGAYVLHRNFPSRIDALDALEEHHERCDGTGYPKGKFESELGHCGKILALSDSIIAIFRNRFDPKKNTWRDVIPIIQTNAQAYFFRHDEILTSIWRRAEMPHKNIVLGDQVVEFVQVLNSQYERSFTWFETLKVGLLEIGFIHGDRQLHAMQNVVFHLSTTARGSALFDPAFGDWLKNLKPADFDAQAKKIQDAYVNLQEFIFHLQKLTRMLKIYVDEHQGEHKKLQRSLYDLLDKVKKILGGIN